MAIGERPRATEPLGGAGSPFLLSVALVTRNRPASLERTLSSLRAQSVQPGEVLVSDDSDPSMAREVEALCERYGCRYVRGPRRGLYANRNHAALRCAGTHIRTMDDDHEFPAGHMEACARAVRGAPGAVWIIGERMPGDPPGREWVCPPQLHPRGFSTTPRPGERIWAIADGAAIYPREIFDRGQRFYEGFVFGASYLEWGSRLWHLGYEIRHLSETYVIHHAVPGGRSYEDPLNDAAARLFAGLCHSFIYQRTWRNMTLTLGEMALTVLRSPRTGWRADLAAVRAFARRRAGGAEEEGADLVRAGT